MFVHNPGRRFPAWLRLFYVSSCFLVVIVARVASYYPRAVAKKTSAPFPSYCWNLFAGEHWCLVQHSCALLELAVGQLFLEACKSVAVFSWHGGLFLSAMHFVL